MAQPASNYDAKLVHDFFATMCEIRECDSFEKGERHEKENLDGY